MGEDMLRAAEEVIERRNASIRNSNNTSEYSVYVSKFFSKTKDALEFLNEHHIDTNDVVSLIKHGGETSVSEYELIFFDRIKTEKYSIVDERWFGKNPSLFKESVELFSVEVRFLAESKFNDYLRFPPKHKDGYRHVYILQQELEWMSGNKIITNISRSDNQLI